MSYRKKYKEEFVWEISFFCKHTLLTTGAAPLGVWGGFSPPTFLLSDHFLFSAKKCLYANKRNQDKPLSQKRVYSKHKSIQSLIMPKFRVLKIKNSKMCFENWNHPLQINLKPRFTERKSREDESKKSWRLMCVRSKKCLLGKFFFHHFHRFIKHFCF